MVTPKRAAIQVVGFAIGVALLVWVIARAVSGANAAGTPGIMESVRSAWEARPALIAGLVLTTLASLVIDGALFWIVLLPVRRLGFWEVQWLTYVAGLSNYFPVRLGIPVRYFYHMRANRLTFWQCTAWFAAVTAVIVAALIAVTAATILDPHLNVLWAVIVLGSLGVIALALRGVALIPVVRARMGEWNALITTNSTYWTGCILRVVEVVLWIARMWCAAEILNLGIDFAAVAVLGVAAIAIMLNPLGRVGFREYTTTAVASWLAGHGTANAPTDAQASQLALLESGGEAAVSILMGLIALPFVWRWFRARRKQPAAVAGGVRQPNSEAKAT